MAIREREGRAKPFFVYWTNPFTKKKESRSFETLEEAKAADSLIKHKLKFERDSFQPPKEEENNAKTYTLEDITYLYLRQRQFTQKCLQDYLSKSKVFLSKYGSRPIEDITNDVLVEIVSDMKDVKPATAKRKLASLVSVLNWAARNGYISNIPKIPKIAIGRNTHFVPPSPDELAAIYAVAAPHIQRVVILGYYIGMRVGESEMFRLMWSDIDLQMGIVRVPNADKGLLDPWREVPIADSVIHLFYAWREADSAVDTEYVVHYKGKPVSSIKTAWARTLRRAGIVRKIRPYDLRHGFATMLLAGGADPGTVAKLMGHSDTTMIFRNYQHVLTSQKKDAVSKLPVFQKVSKKGDQTELVQ